MAWIRQMHSVEWFEAMLRRRLQWTPALREDTYAPSRAGVMSEAERARVVCESSSQTRAISQQIGCVQGALWLKSREQEESS